MELGLFSFRYFFLCRPSSLRRRLELFPCVYHVIHDVFKFQPSLDRDEEKCRCTSSKWRAIAHKSAPTEQNEKKKLPVRVLGERR